MMHASPRDRYASSSNAVSLIGRTRITADDLVRGNTSRWLGIGGMTTQTSLHDRLRVMRGFGLDGFVLNGMASSHDNITGRGKPWVDDASALSQNERTFTIAHLGDDIFQCTFDGSPDVSIPTCEASEFIDRFMILFFNNSSLTNLWLQLRRNSRLPQFNFTIDDPKQIRTGFITGSGVPRVTARSDREMSRKFMIAVSAHDPAVAGMLRYSLYFLDRRRSEFNDENADLSDWNGEFITKINQHFTR
jgi:hypothetical protein